MIEKLFVIPLIRTDYVDRCLKTLYEYNDNFQVCLVDQSIEGVSDYAFKRAHMYMRPYRNQGFAKASNLGMVFGYYQKFPYVCVVNDDVEFMDKRWWQGILDTFAKDPRILAVNPMSPREATWGYGRTSDNWREWKPPEHFVSDSETQETIIPVIDGEPFGYKDIYTPEDYDKLLNKHPLYSNGAVVDAFAGWCPVFRRQFFDDVGLYDEKFFPGGGEDYDIDARAYSCAWPVARDTCDDRFHKRLVSTSKSWVWHHWGKSKDKQAELDPKLFEGKTRWNNNDELWPYGFDVWGHKEYEAGRKPLNRVREIHVEDL